MSIFSRLRKAAKGEERKKATVAQATANPASTSSKHVSTKPVWEATPRTSVSAEEIRTRIAAARRVKSSTSLRTSLSSQHSDHHIDAISEPAFSKTNVPKHANGMALDATPKSSVSAEEIRTRIAASRRLKSSTDLQKSQSSQDTGYNFSESTRSKSIPSSVSAEEIRARIAAAEKLKSSTGLRADQTPSKSSPRSRATSDTSIHRSTIHQNESSMSLNECVMKQTCPPHVEQSGPHSRGWQPMGTYEDYTFRQFCELSDFERSRSSSPLRPKAHRTIGSMSSMPRIKSPLFNIAVEEVDETDYFSSSSSSEESRVSTASSQSTYDSDIQFHQHCGSTPVAMDLPKPSAIKPHLSTMISALPFRSDDESVAVPKTKSNIPTWRYEDYGEDSQLQPTVPMRPKRKPSIPAMFLRKGSTST